MKPRNANTEHKNSLIEKVKRLGAVVGLGATALMAPEAKAVEATTHQSVFVCIGSDGSNSNGVGTTFDLNNDGTIVGTTRFSIAHDYTLNDNSYHQLLNIPGTEGYAVFNW